VLSLYCHVRDADLPTAEATDLMNLGA
jgi:hypothetical protein